MYEQEVSLNHIFDDLSEGFKKLDSMNDSKKQSELKRMTGLMQEAKSYVCTATTCTRVRGSGVSWCHHVVMQIDSRF